MRWKAAAAALAMVLAAAVPLPTERADAAPTGYPVGGIDVSNHQGDVDWTSVAGSGVTFAYAKATEGLDFVDPYFATNDTGARAKGIHFGGYTYGRPDQGAPALQADRLVATAYVSNARRLPPMLDIEWPWFGGDDCYGLTPTQMVDWITAFVERVRFRTGQRPVIYTNPYWWGPCTGNSTAFSSYPLFVAAYGSTAPTVLPSGWTRWTIWQYTATGTVGGVNGSVDRDAFNGTPEQLAAMTQASLTAVAGEVHSLKPVDCWQTEAAQVLCPDAG